MDLKEMAKQAGMHYREMADEFCEADKDGVPLEMLERFAELIRQDEREACAKLCEGSGKLDDPAGPIRCHRCEGEGESWERLEEGD